MFKSMDILSRQGALSSHAWVSRIRAAVQPADDGIILLEKNGPLEVQDMFGVLKIKGYRLLWSTQLLSNLGDAIRNWAILFWVFHASSQSPLMQSMVLLAEYMPALLIGPFAGIWVDRYAFKKVLLASTLLRALLSLAAIPFIISGQIGMVLGLIAISSVVQQFFQPAVSKGLVNLVPKDSLMAANSLSRTTQTSLTLAGPILGALIYQVLGAELSFTVDGILFLAGACLLLVMAVPNSRPAMQNSTFTPAVFWKEFTEGIRFGWQNSIVQAIFSLLCIMSLGIGAINLLNIFLVVNEIGLPEQYVAWGNSVQGAGMLIGALIAGSVSKKLKAYHWLTVWSVGIMVIGIIVLAFSWNEYIMFASRLLIGLGVTLLNISITTLFQLEVPEKLIGRVGSVLETAPLLAMLISLSLSGYLQTLISTRYIFLGSALILFAAGIAALFQLGCIRTMKYKEKSRQSSGF
ncbi:MFS transporter [Paenibacillus donghaensis]|uniref:MFS transporter n=1 Tax=Paenibacillus donghaensis TaxID=414771 RepID=UPI0018843B54|nr:MFS transporter [Paenibacillus donghaensis]MBE9917666.1 MFS transporter [Paenibacillus donghaensis]